MVGSSPTGLVALARRDLVELLPQRWQDEGQAQTL